MASAQAAIPAHGLVGMALALALAGCASGENLDGAFHAQDTGVAGQTAGVSNTSVQGLTVGSGGSAITYECPTVIVRTGASTWQVTEGGALRYQGTMGQLARECAIAGQTMTVKVGIEGRVLLGEKGTAGTVKVPLRVAVVEEGPTPKTITTKFFTVPVEIPPGQPHSAFTVVEDQIAFPLVKPEEIGRYVIYVGYDPQGEKPKPAASRPRPARPKPAASTSAPSASAPAAAPAAAPATSSAKPDAGAPSSDVFGPPPSSSSSTSSGTLNGGGFAPPPSSSAFEPPPR